MERSREHASTSKATADKSLTGLTTAEAQRRLAEYGANEIAERRPHAVLTLLRKCLPSALLVTVHAWGDARATRKIR